MKNSEKGKFEDAWRMAFDNAEQAPSENVWRGVDQGLNRAETIMMKRQVVFYQRLAAATIVFALLLGALSTYYFSDLNNQQKIDITAADITHSTDSNNNTPIIADQKSSTDNNATGDFAMDSETVKKEMKSNFHASFETGERGLSATNSFSGDSTQENDRYISKLILNRQYPTLLSMIPEPLIELNNAMKEITIVRKLPAMPSSMMASKNEMKSKENLWASLGASTGNYSPSADFNSGSSSRVLSQSSTGMNTSNQRAYSTTAARGTTFSLGMNVAKRLSRRWLLQGGVSYLNQSIGYTSNYAVVDGNNKILASVADYSNLDSFSSVIPVSSPYEINSVNKFISIPVQAGYLLIDKKIGLQLNSGVSTDFFMQNTLTDKSGQLSPYSSGAGDESPYRAISWSGLVGTELSYKIATQYRVSIAPGLRYSLNSVLKSDVVSSNPLVWDVGFRFRYIFK